VIGGLCTTSEKLLEEGASLLMQKEESVSFILWSKICRSSFNV
jgi:hypothetical protein